MLLHHDLCYTICPNNGVQLICAESSELKKRAVSTLVRFAGLFRFELELRGFRFYVNKTLQNCFGGDEYRFSMQPIVDPFRPIQSFSF